MFVKSFGTLMSNKLLKRFSSTTHLIFTDQANSSVEKSGMLGSVQLRILPADENGELKREALIEAIKKDIENGLFPCYVRDI